MNKNIPNLLTIFRILIIPAIIASFYIEGKIYHIVAALLFLAAGITDFFDGYFARRLDAQSSLGRFLDPIADKLLVATALMLLVHFNDVGRFDIIPAIAILCREIMISGLREFLAGVHTNLPVTYLAKVKTTVQMGAIFLLLLGVEGPSFHEFEQVTDVNMTEFFGRMLLWVAAILTWVTGYGYLKSGFRHIIRKTN